MSETKQLAVSKGTVTRIDAGTGDGNSKRLYVGRIGTHDYRSFLKFTLDWTDVGQVVTATLVVFTDDGGGLAPLPADADTPRLDVRRLTSAFVEGNNADGVFNASDYTNPKATTIAHKTSAMLHPANEATRIDITALFNSWVPNGVKNSAGHNGSAVSSKIHGLALYAMSKASKDSWSGWSEDAVDGSKHPYIELVYKLGVTQPDIPGPGLAPVGPVASVSAFVGEFHDPRPTDKLARTDVEVYSNSATNGGDVVTGGSLVWSANHVATDTEALNGIFNVVPSGMHLEPTVNYKWRARVQDDQGDPVSHWTDLQQFSISNTPPDAPTINQPNDGESFDSLSGVIFSVDYADTDLDEALAYQMQLAVDVPDDAAYSLTLWDTGKVYLANDTESRQPPFAFFYGGPGLVAGTYNLRARVWDVKGGVSDWSAPTEITLTADFNIQPGSAPRPQVAPQAPWRILIKDMVSKYPPAIELVQSSSGGDTDFGTDLASGINRIEDTTTTGYADAPSAHFGFPSSSPWGWNSYVSGAGSLVYRGYIDLGSALSIGAADGDADGGVGFALEWGESATGPWHEVASATTWNAGQLGNGVDFVGRRITFTPITARWWAFRVNDNTGPGLHYFPGESLRLYKLYGSAGASLGATPVVGNTLLAWLTSRTGYPALPTGFTNIATVRVGTSGVGYGRMCRRTVVTGDTGDILTNAGTVATVTEWSGVYAGFRSSNHHASTTKFRAGGIVYPAKGVEYMLVGGGVLGQANSPSLSVSPLSGNTEIADTWSGAAPLHYMHYRHIATSTGKYAIGGTVNHAVKYGGVTVMLTRAAKSRGPNQTIAIIRDAKGLGASKMHNAPGELHFTLPVDHPQIGVIEPKRVHWALEQYERDGWREKNAGLVWDADATEREVVFTGIDYKGLINVSVDTQFNINTPKQPYNKGGSFYGDKTIRTVVLDQLNKLVSEPNGILNFLTVGSIATMNEKVTIYSTMEQRLGFIVGLLDSHRQGTEKRTAIEVRKTSVGGYEVVVVDDPGVERPNLRMRYGELVNGYRVIVFGKDWASVVAGVGRYRDGVKVAYRVASGKGIDPAVWGNIPTVRFFDGVADSPDLLRRLNQAALGASKLGSQMGLGLRISALNPDSGYQLTDFVPVDIVHGAINTNNFGSGLYDILGWSLEVGDPAGQPDLVLTLLPHEDLVPPNDDLIVSDPAVPQTEWTMGWGAPDPDALTSLYYLDQSSGNIYVRNEDGDPSDMSQSYEGSEHTDEEDVTDP